jgi:hypothetical protein
MNIHLLEEQKQPINKWMKYLNLSESAYDDIPAPIDVFIVGADYDLKHLHNDFPHINKN